MKNKVAEILSQKMSRKQFLAYVGSGLMVILGVSSIVKAFQPGATKTSFSYGSSPYGGNRS